MKNFANLSCIAVLLSISISFSCKQGAPLSTREDSLSLAKTIVAKYPELQIVAPVAFTKNHVKVFDPMNWEDILRYGRNYDANPAVPGLDGFLINAEGLHLIRQNPNYEMLYLRLGKRSAGLGDRRDYTVMIVPLKADTSILHTGAGSSMPGQNSNYDQLDPCPVYCPKGWPTP